MSISLVQSATPVSVSSSLTLAITFASKVRAGNLLVIGIDTAGSGTAVSSVVGSASGATYTRRGSRIFVSGGGGIELWAGVCLNDNVTETVTVTASASVNIEVYAREYSAAGGWKATAITANGTGTSATPTSGNMVTTDANSAIVAMMNGPGGVISAGPSFTGLQTTSFIPAGMENRLNVAPGTYQGIFGLNSSMAWGIVAATFAQVGYSISGAVSFGCTVASAMVLNRAHAITGAVSFGLSVSSGMAFSRAFSITGDVSFGAAVAATMIYTPAGGGSHHQIDGSVSFSAVPASTFLFPSLFRGETSLSRFRGAQAIQDFRGEQDISSWRGVQ